MRPDTECRLKMICKKKVQVCLGGDTYDEVHVVDLWVNSNINALDHIKQEFGFAKRIGETVILQ